VWEVDRRERVVGCGKGELMKVDGPKDLHGAAQQREREEEESKKARERERKKERKIARLLGSAVVGRRGGLDRVSE